MAQSGQAASQQQISYLKHILCFFTQVLSCLGKVAKAFFHSHSPNIGFLKELLLLSCRWSLLASAEGTAPSLLLFWTLLLLCALPWDACISFDSALCRPLLVLKRKFKVKLLPKTP